MDAQSDRLGRMPSLGSLVKISVGLVLVAILSSAFVYAETATVDVNGVSYDVDYTGTGVTISSISADSSLDPELILIVTVSDSPGILEIKLDRNFFDSKLPNGDDDIFFVLADFDEAKYSEINTTDQSRTLSIELPQGTEEVEIIGTQFGSSGDMPVEEEEVTQPEEEVTLPEEELEVTPPEEEEVIVPTPIEKPVVEKPKTECGVGTILKDGVCILDERCGPGSILTDGECIAEPVTDSDVPVQGLGKQLVIGVVAAFIVAGVVGLVLALMSKASKSKN